ncbi:MAG: hypothetical protein CMM28_15720 [Rhodospirillaceae bacterium]|nr:hypothetical protein [Rhodospirillaceae bacterium]
MLVWLRSKRWQTYAAISLGLGTPALVLGKTLIFASLFLPALAVLAHVQFFQKNPISRSLKENRWLIYLALCTASLWLISSIFSYDNSKSLLTWMRIILLISFFYLLVNFLRSDKNLLPICLKSLISGYGIILVVANFSLYIDSMIFDLYASVFKTEIVSEVLRISPVPVLLQLLKPFYSVAACALPIILWAGLRMGGLWRNISFASVPLILILLYGNGLQPGMSAAFGVAAALCAFIFTLLLLRLNRLSVITVLVVTISAASIFAVFILISLPVPPVSPEPLPKLPLPDWHRQVIWGFTLDVAMQYPLLGIGPNTINLFPGASAIIPGMNQEYVPSHPHNWFLEIFSETGLLGVISLIATLCAAFAILFKRAAQKAVPAIAAITLLASFLCSSLGNFSIWSMWWLATLGVLLCLPLAALEKDTSVGYGSNR